MQRSRRGWVAVAALLLCGLVAVIWVTRDAGMPAQGEAPREASASTDTTQQTAGEQQVEPAIAQVPREQIVGATSLDAMPTDDHRFIGRVLDPAREPVAGADVTLQRREAEVYWSLDLAENARVDRIGATTSDADGWFSFELPRGVPHEIEIRARGHAEQREMLCYAGQRRGIVLSFGAVLTGRVHLAHDRSPIEGARIRFWRLPGQTLGSGTTDAAGRFHFENLSPGPITLELLVDHGRGPGWQKLQLIAGEEIRQDFAIETGDEARGVVRDARTGAPIAGAEVGDGWTFRKSVRTDADGAYRMRGFPAPGNSDLHARATGYAETSIVVNEATPIRDGVRTVDFVLEPAGTASGRVLGPDLRPLPGVYVAAVAKRGLAHGDWSAARTAIDGGYRLTELAHDLTYSLVVRSPGLGTRIFEFPSQVSIEHELRLPDVVLQPGGGIAGVVRSRGGDPLVETDIELIPLPVDRYQWVDRPMERGSGEPFVSNRRTRTDVEGRFRYADLAAGGYRVRARIASAVVPEIRIELLHGEWKTDLVLVADLGLAIAGEVRVSDGDLVRDGVVYVYREQGAPGQPLHGRLAKGRFRVPGLAPGKYRVDVYPVAPPAWPAFMRTGVDAGTEDLVLTAPPALRISGRVFEEHGVPEGGALVTARTTAGRHRRGSAQSDRDGRYSLVVAAGEPIDLQVWTGLGLGSIERRLKNADAAKALRPPVEDLDLHLVELKLK